jgi:hypothetical protein
MDNLQTTEITGHSLEVGKAEIKESADSVSEEGFLLHNASLLCPQHCRRSRHTPTGLFYKGTNAVHESKILMT